MSGATTQFRGDLHGRLEDPCGITWDIGSTPPQ